MSQAHHLNHGSFGAVLQEVPDIQTAWRHRFEANPTLFVMNELPAAMDRARESIGRFVGADSAGIAAVRNATTGVASVLNSIESLLEPGDQLLTTAHDYNAVRQILRFAAARTGAEVVVARVPFPTGSAPTTSAPGPWSPTHSILLVPWRPGGGRR